MKRLLFLVVVFLVALNLNAQSDVSIGIKGGLNLTFFKVELSNFGPNTETATGNYAGVFADFEFEEAFSLQPELLYIGLNDFKFLNVPIYAKYEVANNLYLMAGPSINYFFDFFTNKLKLGADICTSYNILPTLDVHVKFALGLQELAPNGLFFGIGYKL